MYTLQYLDKWSHDNKMIFSETHEHSILTIFEKIIASYPLNRFWWIAYEIERKSNELSDSTLHEMIILNFKTTILKTSHIS